MQERERGTAGRRETVEKLLFAVQQQMFHIRDTDVRRFFFFHALPSNIPDRSCFDGGGSRAGGPAGGGEKNPKSLLLALRVIANS